MAKRRRQHRRTTEQSASTPRADPRPVAWTTVFGRPVAWSAVISAAVMAAVAGPGPAAHADPIAVPDAGVRPTPSGELRLPGSRPGATPTAPTTSRVLGPLATEIIAAETDVARLGEQLNSLDQELTAARQSSAEARQLWQAAADEMARLRAQADAAVSEAYRSATQLEPFGSFGSDLRSLGILVPGPAEPQTGTEATARELTRAEEDERTKLLGYNSALAVELDLTARRAGVFTDFSLRQAALVDLKRRNADQLARIEAEREAFEQSRAGEYGKGGIAVDGKVANPNALKAVGFALAQLGKPYEWGAEGPDRFDCSGLMWASYRPYRLLNRVAKDQFRQTSTDQVPLNKLLPGDLLFFATNMNDWTTIHHVGMYLGDGKMVHAPTTGDVVKISTVWWSRLFGATRVLDPVPVPVPVPTTTPPPPTTPPPTTPPPTTPPPTTPPPTTPPPTTPPPTTPPPTTPPPPPAAEPSSPPASASPTDTPASGSAGPTP